jgi:hypothetical protein
VEPSRRWRSGRNDEQESSRVRPFIFPASVATRTRPTSSTLNLATQPDAIGVQSRAVGGTEFGVRLFQTQLAVAVPLTARRLQEFSRLAYIASVHGAMHEPTSTVFGPIRCPPTNCHLSGHASSIHQARAVRRFAALPLTIKLTFA